MYESNRISNVIYDRAKLVEGPKPKEHSAPAVEDVAKPARPAPVHKDTTSPRKKSGSSVLVSRDAKKKGKDAVSEKHVEEDPKPQTQTKGDHHFDFTVRLVHQSMDSFTEVKQRAYCGSVAKALGIASSQVSVTGVQAGSVIVSTRVSGLSSEEEVQRVQAAVQDPEGPVQHVLFLGFGTAEIYSSDARAPAEEANSVAIEKSCAEYNLDFTMRLVHQSMDSFTEVKQRAYCGSVAKALGIASSQVSVTGVQAGSVIVSTRVSGLSSEEEVQRVQAAVQDPEGPVQHVLFLGFGTAEIYSSEAKEELSTDAEGTGLSAPDAMEEVRDMAQEESEPSIEEPTPVIEAAIPVDPMTEEVSQEFSEVETLSTDPVIEVAQPTEELSENAAVGEAQVTEVDPSDQNVVETATVDIPVESDSMEPNSKEDKLAQEAVVQDTLVNEEAQGTPADDPVESVATSVEQAVDVKPAVENVEEIAPPKETSNEIEVQSVEKEDVSESKSVVDSVPEPTHHVDFILRLAHQHLYAFMETKQDIFRASISKALSVPIANVTLTSIRSGSVIVSTRVSGLTSDADANRVLEAVNDPDGPVQHVIFLGFGTTELCSRAEVDKAVKESPIAESSPQKVAAAPVKGKSSSNIGEDVPKTKKTPATKPAAKASNVDNKSVDEKKVSPVKGKDSGLKSLGPKTESKSALNKKSSKDLLKSDPTPTKASKKLSGSKILPVPKAKKSSVEDLPPEVADEEEVLTAVVETVPEPVEEDFATAPVEEEPPKVEPAAELVEEDFAVVPVDEEGVSAKTKQVDVSDPTYDTEKFEEED